MLNGLTALKLQTTSLILVEVMTSIVPSPRDTPALQYIHPPQNKWVGVFKYAQASDNEPDLVAETESKQIFYISVVRMNTPLPGAPNFLQSLLTALQMVRPNATAICRHITDLHMPVLTCTNANRLLIAIRASTSVLSYFAM